MREIKFRAWVFYENEWRWADLVTVYSDGSWSYEIFEHDYVIMSPAKNGDIIEQYTGLKDINGVEIYEGDIVNCYHWGYRSKEKKLIVESKVVWSNDDKGWTLDPDPTDGDRYDLFRNIEVIGNIHQGVNK